MSKQIKNAEAGDIFKIYSQIGIIYHDFKTDELKLVWASDMSTSQIPIEDHFHLKEDNCIYLGNISKIINDWQDEKLPL